MNTTPLLGHHNITQNTRSELLVNHPSTPEVDGSESPPPSAGIIIIIT